MRSVHQNGIVRPGLRHRGVYYMTQRKHRIEARSLHGVHSWLSGLKLRKFQLTKGEAQKLLVFVRIRPKNVVSVPEREGPRKGRSGRSFSTMAMEDEGQAEEIPLATAQHVHVQLGCLML